MWTLNQINDRIKELSDILWGKVVSEDEVSNTVKEIRFLTEISEKEILTHLDI